jgi:photosystem II stability/assembly factor-like uncharacterized protein
VGDSRRNSRSIALALIAGALLTACEARLDLAGVEWQREQTRMRFDMYQAIARSEEKVVAVSSTGAVLASPDRGHTWSRTHLPGNPTLIDVATCPDGRFVALDTRRLLWTDVGEGWTESPIDTTENVLSLTCDPRNRVWVTAGFSTLLHSADGGETWEMQSMDEDLQFTTIQFVDEDWGVATGEFGTVAITEDGGETWNPAEYIPNEFYPMAAVFLDRRRGFVAGLNGITWVTTDGAMSWQRHDAPTPTPLYGITADTGQVVAVGEGGAVFSWDGQSWRPVAGVPTMLAYLRAVEVVDDMTVIVGGGFGAIMRLSTGEPVTMAEG